MKEETIFQKVETFYEFLRTGKPPEGFELKYVPKLTPKKSFTIIYVIQEYLGVLPDTIEQCQGCYELFDTDSEGYYLDDQYDLDGKELPKKYWGHWCDSCVPAVDFELR